MGSESRRRQKHIMVRVSEDEHAAIGARAAQFGYGENNRATLLRDLGLGIEPKSAIDAQAVLDLLQVSADLGRLGGLLKHWLQSVGSDRDTAVDVRDLLSQITATQALLKAKVMAL